MEFEFPAFEKIKAIVSGIWMAAFLVFVFGYRIVKGSVEFALVKLQHRVIKPQR